MPANQETEANKDGAPSGLAVGAGFGVLGQLRRHRAQMAPHVAARAGGQLIIAAIAEIERLENIIEAANLATTAECTCGGNAKDDPACCPACAVYHRIETAKRTFAPNTEARQPGRTDQ